MNTEEEKKKELEKRGEDNPQSGREFPGSSMSKDQREDAERVKNESAGGDVRSQTGDQPENRASGSPDENAGATEADRNSDTAEKA